MTIRQRVQRLEKQAPVVGDDLELIGIVGVEPGGRDAPAEPTNYFFYCLDRNCPENQHAPLLGETYAEALARIEAEHREGREK